MRLQCEPSEKSATAMRLAEKAYRGAGADLSEVIDFRHRSRCTSSSSALVVAEPLTLPGAPEATVYSLRGFGGFFFIDQAVPVASEQLAWSRRCLHRYCAPPLAVTNLSQQVAAAPGGAEETVTLPPSQAPALPQPPEAPDEKLRWATLGLHYDWTTRTYPNPKPEPGEAAGGMAAAQVPPELGALARRIAAAVGQSLAPETAIVNFYRHNSTMCAHQDDAEAALECPVVSVSFGCAAVFLLGGLSREMPPVALWVHSGDAMVLGGQTRLAFHAMARVAVGSCPEALLPGGGRSRGCAAATAAAAAAAHDDDDGDRDDDTGDQATADQMVRAYLAGHRININVRQVNSCLNISLNPA